MAHIQVCFAAYSSDEPRLAGLIESLVNSLVSSCRERQGEIIGFLGGYRGLMKRVADALRDKGVGAVLVIPRDYEGFDEPEFAIVVRTGMDSKGRSAVLVRSCDVVVVVGGASGTMLEALAAYGIGVPVVYLRRTGLPSDRLADAYPDGIIDPRLGAGIWYTDDPREAGRLACSLGLEKRGSR